MSNVNFNYADFTVTDFRGSTTTLSSYCLPFTPLQFTPILPDNAGTVNKVVWSFGNGETSDEYSPSFYYTRPGKYTIKLFLYDNFNQANLTTAEKTVIIKDYIEDTINIQPSNNNTLSALAGYTTDPITISQFYPARYNKPRLGIERTQIATNPIGFLPASYTDPVLLEPVPSTVEYVVEQVTTFPSITYRVTGSNTTNYFLLPPNKYNHLEAYNSLLKKNFIPSLSTYEFVEISKLDIDLSPIYGYISSNDVYTTPLSSQDTLLIGYSGQDKVYYRDDFSCDKFTIEFLKTTNDYSNPFGITLSGSIGVNLVPSSISITSNGVDGETYPISSFYINPNKFINSQIHFTIKLKDNNNVTIKEASKVNLQQAESDLDISLIGDNINSISYTPHSLLSDISAFKSGGVFKGYIDITGSITEPLTGIRILARIQNLIEWLSLETGDDLITENDLLLYLQNPEYVAGAYSSPFNIYPSNYYKIYKKGEEFDGEAMYKSLRFQETLLDKEKLFTNLLGSVFGNETSDTEALGKKVYERISNFVDNTVNIDTAEIIRILSLGDTIGYNNTVFDNNLTNFPNKIQRLASLISINKNKLFGETNKFKKNFNSYGTTSKEKYGLNLGDPLDIQTETVSKDDGLVAYEKFSKKYILLNTYQPLCASPAQTSPYSITDYNDTWGWPLLLPTSYTSDDITKYYTFYKYTSGYADNIVGSVLNFDLTTLDQKTQYSDLVKDNGIYENIILDTLYQSLSLTK